jgi:prenyltransferase beta subunit
MRRIAIALVLSLCLVPRLHAADPDEQTRRQRLDESIKRALEYLHKTQNTDGSWSGGPANNPAITSLCVMAFLSSGHVPGEGPYGDTVKKGIHWVLQRQGENGLIAVGGHHEMYHHGIATLMLAEACGMCDERLGKELRKKLEKAVEIILNAQRKDGMHRGGWRYTRVGSDGDISVTGWQVMALRAAKNLGCDVPAERIAEAVEYIKRCRDDRSGGFNYYPGSRLTVPCTGTSILALEICGKDQHRSPELLRAGAYLLKEENRPRWGSAHFFYGIYYCSQATFQLGGNYWDDFRPKLHKELLTNQRPEGCWIGADASSAAYGNNYCTAMSVLSLTVEYRFLPIYQRGEEPSDK